MLVRWFVLFSFVSISAIQLPAQTASGVDLFEKKIRPTLAAKCFACHSSKMKSPMGGFSMDTKAGLQRGGASGPEIVPGKPEESRLLKAIRYSDTALQMPPGGKLGDDVVQAFTEWIRLGAPDPRQDTGPVAGPAQIDIEKGKKWWAFQPVKQQPPPTVAKSDWARTGIDRFILASLEKNHLQPSSQADPRTLVRRVYLDMAGVAPTYEETEAFARNPSPDAYRQLIDRLLASPHYGERWARYWLDVARYGEDNPLNGQSLGFYTFAWRYRDWVIGALNKDVPYDRFVKLQLAADEMPDVPRDDWRALGYQGMAPVVHKDLRLSAEVIETFASDDWDERVDSISRGVLGLTVGCARCHDHKFDPIRTKDYYSMAGVFASTSQVVRPLFAIDPETERRLLWIEQRLFVIEYLSSLLTREPGTDPEGSARRVAAFRIESATLKAEIAEMGRRYPEIPKEVEKYIASGSQPYGKIKPYSDESPFINAVYDSAQWIDGADKELTILDYRPGQARDLHVFRRGNVANQGELAPRGFPAVLSKSADLAFHKGSGREELAERIFTDAAPLAARVIVNRVWGWHFGQGLVGTPSDFGAQGDKPSHPELLDDLAARFIAHGWSLKWLHREILLSGAYRQGSQPQGAAMQVDPENRLLWRFNPRRMDFEAFRDTILRSTGSLSEKLYGPSLDLESSANVRRTIYSRALREKMPSLLRLYDVPDPSQHSPQRSLTTTPIQQLFVLNSSFLKDQALTLAASAEGQNGEPAKIRYLYRKVLARDPDAGELKLGTDYLAQATLAQYTQGLIATNEFIFWP